MKPAYPVIAQRGQDVRHFRTLTECCRKYGIRSVRELVGLIETNRPLRGIRFDWDVDCPPYPMKKERTC
jgi:hypothetical protein